MVQLPQLGFGERRKRVRRSVITVTLVLAILFCGLTSVLGQDSRRSPHPLGYRISANFDSFSAGRGRLPGIDS